MVLLIEQRVRQGLDPVRCLGWMYVHDGVAQASWQAGRWRVHVENVCV